MTQTWYQRQREQRRAQDHKRLQEQPWRAWYKRKQWRAIRTLRLAEEPLCRMCSAQGKLTPATVVDHVKPHRGEWALFNDYVNTQALCARHHDSTKQGDEGRGYSVEVGTDGYPVDPAHPANRA